MIQTLMPMLKLLLLLQESVLAQELASLRTAQINATEHAFPTPATHAILTQLKAGGTVHQAGELPKTH